MSLGAWVKVVADLKGVGLTVGFHAMFYCDGVMCLAGYTDQRPLSVHFLRFRLERSPHSTDLVNLTVINFHSYPIPSGEEVSDCIVF